MKTLRAHRPWLVVLFFAAEVAFGAERGVRLINGTPVPAGKYKEVIKISTNGAACTATVVGPRVIITAAHCANNDANSTFTIDGTQYTAKMTRSSLYPSKDHDIALGTTTQVINVQPISVGGTAAVGNGLTLFGYGCTNPNGTGGNDGVLRMGDTVITGFADFDMVSRKADGAALCFGDSGGPAYSTQNGKTTLLGINSKGNIKDTNWDIRIDIPETQDFIKGYANTNNVEICGINKNCDGGPQPTAPTCTIAASPKLIKIGNSVNLSMSIQGNATSATIDGQVVSISSPSLTITPGTKGTFQARGTVAGPGGSGSCQDTYTVEDTGPIPQVPTCTLSAIPSSVNVGETVTLEMTTTGNVTAADIDGTPVNFPLGKKMITTTQVGSFNSKGTVRGAQGSSTCAASYSVTNDPTPPNTPNLAAVPTYCGDNTLPTQVRKVCLAVIKKDSTIPDLRVTEALIITYQDQSKEIMPVISRRMRPQNPGDAKVLEDMTLYANTTVTADTYQVLDSRTATLTKLPPIRDGEIPASIEGRSAKGQYFIVDSLQAYAVSK